MKAPTGSQSKLTPFAGLPFAFVLCEFSHILVVDTALNCENYMGQVTMR